jgi:hypothetical protein
VGATRVGLIEIISKMQEELVEIVKAQINNSNPKMLEP